jgi:hypothetical protein
LFFPKRGFFHARMGGYAGSRRGGAGFGPWRCLRAP